MAILLSVPKYSIFHQIITNLKHYNWLAYNISITITSRVFEKYTGFSKIKKLCTYSLIITLLTADSRRMKTIDKKNHHVMSDVHNRNMFIPEIPSFEII